MKNQSIRQYLHARSASKHIPLSGTFELTPCCNMNCKMCYVRLSKKEQEAAGRLRDAKEWISLGQICRDAGMLFLLLTGGEPFLRPDFREIYENLYDMGLMISINTNGTMLTEETVRWLAQRPPTKINITLYGGSKEVYRDLCQYEEGFKRATNAILMLKKANIHVGINVSYTNENEEDMNRILGFAKEHDVPIRMTSYMFPPVRKSEKAGKVIDPNRMTAKLAGCVMYKAARFDCEEDAWIEKRKKLLAGMPIQTEEDCPRDEKMRCTAGKCAFWVTWDWNIRACGMMNTPTMQLTLDNFQECWANMLPKIQALCLPKECSTCKNRRFCIICGAAAQAEGEGDMTKRPEYICEMIETYAELLEHGEL